MLFRALRAAPAGAALTAANWRRERRPVVRADGQELPAGLAAQGFRPAVPYPGWDDNWDYCDLGTKDVAKRLGHQWPIEDWPEAIRKLYAEHSERSASKVEKLIDANKDDLPGLYKRAFTSYAFGGGITRHIILVRHGQYEEQRELAKQLKNVNPHYFGLPGDSKADELDAARVLTALGRQQALKAGDRLAQLLEPALTTAGREGHVRIHVSTLTRAKETAELIASRLPSHVIRLDPNPMLVEGDPPAHTIPYGGRGNEDSLFGRARDVHVEGARIEAAFRSLFYRDVPCKLPKNKDDETDANLASSKKGHSLSMPRHEYEIVVCHMNVIRYFTLRALQLPPEAWLRLGGDNGSITHLKIRPSGSVSLHCFGDSGFMPLEEITFGMRQGLE